ncbi:unnamed protein product [Nippostrongylus brasiliensis]|uniref:Uncharacterized protein n=1 Tax=Nippostrongylus brasiliensis TaxID=27835 RepID=A0A0N4Y3T2_NIPBR|nr:hypothetical protein Q1695_000968 [Nippostrongylus brasiliensis]VDL74087.1 unnamed protein product [Nippostrongylus brasiliensis]
MHMVEASPSAQGRHDEGYEDVCVIDILKLTDIDDISVLTFHIPVFFFFFITTGTHRNEFKAVGKTIAANNLQLLQ